MRILFGIFIIITAIGGCSSTKLTVREESVIPTNKLSDAYSFANECVAVGGVEEDFIPEVGNTAEGDEKQYLMNSCLDNMFILYGEAEYAILESDSNGKFRTIYSSANIVDINRYLDL